MGKMRERAWKRVGIYSVGCVNSFHCPSLVLVVVFVTLCFHCRFFALLPVIGLQGIFTPFCISLRFTQLQ